MTKETRKSKLYGREKQVAHLLKQFGPFAELLDVGCYDGATTQTYSQFARKTYAVDPSIRQIKIATRNFSELVFRHGYAENIPFTSNKFDCVVFSDVLEHVSDEKAALGEIYRVLKPGGILIITTPHTGFFRFLDPLNYSYYLSLLIRSTSKRPFHRHYSLPELAGLLASSGFKSRILLVKRSGFLLTPLIYNLEILCKALRANFLLTIVKASKNVLGEAEWQVDFGLLGYYVAIAIEK